MERSDEIKRIQRTPFAQEYLQHLSRPLSLKSAEKDDHQGGVEKGREAMGGLVHELEVRSAVIGAQLAELLKEAGGVIVQEPRTGVVTKQPKAKQKVLKLINTSGEQEGSTSEDYTEQLVAWKQLANERRMQTIQMEIPAWLQALLSRAEVVHDDAVDVEGDDEIATVQSGGGTSLLQQALHSALHEQLAAPEAQGSTNPYRYLRHIRPFSFGEEDAPASSSGAAANPQAVDPFMDDTTEGGYQYAPPPIPSENLPPGIGAHSSSMLLAGHAAPLHFTRTTTVAPGATSASNTLAVDLHERLEASKKMTTIKKPVAQHKKSTKAAPVPSAFPSLAQLVQHYTATSNVKTKQSSQIILKAAGDLLLPLHDFTVPSKVPPRATSASQRRNSFWRVHNIGALIFLPRDPRCVLEGPSLGLGIDLSRLIHREDEGHEAEILDSLWPVLKRDAIHIDAEGDFIIARDQADSEEDPVPSSQCQYEDFDGEPVHFYDDEDDDAATVDDVGMDTNQPAPRSSSLLVIAKASAFSLACLQSDHRHIPSIPELQVIIRQLMNKPPATSLLKFTELAAAYLKTTSSAQHEYEKDVMEKIQRRAFVALIFLADGYNRGQTSSEIVPSTIYQMEIKRVAAEDAEYDAEISFVLHE